MELALLLHQEPWRQDLTLLQRWGALDLVDWREPCSSDGKIQRQITDVP